MTMLRNSSIFSLLAGLAFAISGGSVAAANKCVVNGTVTYQQTPCPSGVVRKPPTIQELNAQEQKRRASAAATAPANSPLATSGVRTSFSCDGRQHCSQMKSCAEATYFLGNCPGVKMDGDKNGIPCEKQWCGR